MSSNPIPDDIGQQQEKQCSLCGMIKPISQYWRLGRHTERTFARCKDCVKRVTAEYEKTGQRRAWKKRWIDRHPEKDKEAKRKYARENKEKLLAYQRRRRAESPDVSREGCRRRAIRRRKVGGKHTRAQFAQVCAQQYWKCYYCEINTKLVRDHVMPVARGGTDDIGNIVAACQTCNSKKGGRTLPEFAKRILEIRGECRPQLVWFAIRFLDNPSFFSRFQFHPPVDDVDRLPGGQPRYTRWSAEESEFLRENYATLSIRALARGMGRSVITIVKQSKNLALGPKPIVRSKPTLFEPARVVGE